MKDMNRKESNVIFNFFQPNEHISLQTNCVFY
jgi:hypothetical protein